MILERGMVNAARLLNQAFGRDVSDIRGAGAAGMMTDGGCWWVMVDDGRWMMDDR